MSSFPLGLASLQRDAAAGRALPPVETWNPAHCGDIDIRIARDGTWYHQGSPIGRRELVRLFSTILRRDPDGFVLVTPAEKMRIVVEDAPFMAVLLDVENSYPPLEGGSKSSERSGDDFGEGSDADRNQRLVFTTNVGDLVVAGPANPIRVETDPATGEPAPYIHVRKGLEARIARPVFYQLADLAVPGEGGMLGVWGGGEFYPLGRPRMSAPEESPAAIGRRIVCGGIDLLRSRLLHEPPLLPLMPTRSDYDLNPQNRPAKKPDLTPAAVLLPLILRREPHVLLTQRTDSLTQHAGQVAFPGGRVEPKDVSLVETALRETQEETGIEPAFVTVAGFLDAYETGTGFAILPVVGILSEGFALAPDAGEVASIFEVPLAFLLDPANRQRQSREFQGRLRSFYAFTYEGHYIWGATAAMLIDFAERITAP